MSGFSQYSAKVPQIINYTIVDTDTWELAAAQVKGVRRWWIKARETTDNAFRLDLTTASSPSHDNYITTSGIGFSMDECDLPNVYVYGTLGTVIEILYFS